jgi:hypothetical protein
LFENTVERSHVGDEPSLQTAQQNLAATGLEAGRKLTSFIQQLPIVKNYLGGLGPLWFLTVRNQIICFDDIERRGKGLSVRDVLGLVSFLKERRDCTIMLILNDEALESDKDDFKMYYEKVVDITLTFAPTPTECADIALSKSKLKFLRETCIALGLPNIRTIKKIERMLKKIEPWLRSMDERVWSQAVNSVTLFGWAVYDKLTAPPLEFILNHNPASKFIPGEKEKITEQEAAWIGLMRNIDFYSADDFDQALLAGIQVGFFDREAIEKHAKELDKEIKNQKRHASFKAAWDLYRGSFEPNEEEVVKALYDSTIEHLAGINIFNIDPTVCVLRKLGRSDLADDLVKQTFATKTDVREEIEFGKSMFHRELEDPQILIEIGCLPPKRVEQRSPEEILSSVVANNYYLTDQDLPVLASMPIDSYVAFFKKSADKDLKKIVETCLRCQRITPPSQYGSEIASRTSEALGKIASESRINRLRVEDLGERLKPRQNRNQQMSEEFADSE